MKSETKLKVGLVLIFCLFLGGGMYVIKGMVKDLNARDITRFMAEPAASYEASEDAVWSYASIIHAILNSHAQKFSEQATYLFFSDDVLKEAIYALMEACKNSSN